MSHGPAPVGGIGGVVGGVDGGATGESHCWLIPPWQSQRMTFVPLAVPCALASRQRPECTPEMVPPALTFHCWLACPLQSQMMTGVPLAVPCPEASRHLLPYTMSCFDEV